MKTWHVFIIVFFAAKAVNQPSFIELLYEADLPSITVTAPVVDEEEIEILARLVSAEAGNQSYEGQLAVLDVVYNRLNNNYRGIYKDYKDVIFRPGQFDGVYSKYWFNPKPQHYKVARDKVIYNKSILSYEYEYFHNPVTSTDRKHVRETEKNGDCIIIDDHTFCKRKELM